MTSLSIAVIGGGITGLSAAWELSSAERPPQITLFEGQAAVGGKLRRDRLADQWVDFGAESFLVRRPEALALIEELGLTAELVYPEPVGATIFHGQQLHPLPKGTLMGVPSDPQSVRELLGPRAVARIAAERHQTWPKLTTDRAIGDFIRERIGPEVVDCLLEPLLGGVYAGRAGELSTQATVPQLWQAARDGTSVVAAAAAAIGSGASKKAVFAGLRHGVGQLPAHLAEQLGARQVELCSGQAVAALLREPGGWRIRAAGKERHFDALILATPANPAASLLGPGRAADLLGAIDYASVALVTFAFDQTPVGLRGSGVLIPPTAGLAVKAVTYSSQKWAWQAGPRTMIRASVGRFRDQRALDASDADLSEQVLADLRQLPGVQLPPPVATEVTRWPRALPQYAVGHSALIAEVHREVELRGRIAAAGAYDQGVGIPACIASGRAAARKVLTQLLGEPAGPQQ